MKKVLAMVTVSIAGVFLGVGVYFAQLDIQESKPQSEPRTRSLTLIQGAKDLRKEIESTQDNLKYWTKQEREYTIYPAPTGDARARNMWREDLKEAKENRKYYEKKLMILKR